jgi:hypothetical protein
MNLVPVHLGANRLTERSGRAESQIRDCPRPEPWISAGIRSPPLAHAATVTCCAAMKTASAGAPLKNGE